MYVDGDECWAFVYAELVLFAILALTFMYFISNSVQFNCPDCVCGGCRRGWAASERYYDDGAQLTWIHSPNTHHMNVKYVHCAAYGDTFPVRWTSNGSRWLIYAVSSLVTKGVWLKRFKWKLRLEENDFPFREMHFLSTADALLTLICVLWKRYLYGVPAYNGYMNSV